MLLRPILAVKLLKSYPKFWQQIILYWRTFWYFQLTFAKSEEPRVGINLENTKLKSFSAVSLILSKVQLETIFSWKGVDL